MRTGTWMVAAAAGMLWAGSALALVTGTVVGPGSAAVPIAIVPPIDAGGGAHASERFSRALARALELSGLFTIVDPSRHAERPPEVSLRTDATDFGREYRGFKAFMTRQWRPFMKTPERAEQRVRFIEQYRSYVINYNLGQDLVKRHVEKLGGTDDQPEKRWEIFTRLLSTPQVPSAL